MRTPSLLQVAGFAVIAGLFPAAANAQNYTLSILTSDGSVTAPQTDPNLINPWGMSRSSAGPWWISDNGTGKSTLYNATGTAQTLVVTVPSASGSGTGNPTGTIYNGSPDFELTPDNPAIFLFCTEDGTISGWNPAVNPSTAIVKVNNPGAVYKGLTSAVVNGAQFLFAANFASGKIEIYDTQFKPVHSDLSAFAEPALMRKGLIPFNVQNIGGTLFVAYAKPDSEHHDNVNGPGLGYVAAFTPSGRLVQQFQYGSFLNAPWGLALAPSDFGSFSHDLLVGQFGSGQVLAFNVESGKLDGILADENNGPLAIEGLWGISFGSSTASGAFNTLYFTAGPNEESHGLFGTLTPVTATLTQGNNQ